MLFVFLAIGTSLPCTAQTVSYPRTTYVSQQQVVYPAAARTLLTPPAFADTSTTSQSDSVYPAFESHERFDAVSIDLSARYGMTAIRQARQSAIQFRSTAASSATVVSNVANTNANLADQWANLAESYQSLSTRLHEVAQKVTSTATDYEDLRTRPAEFGLTPTLGLFLRDKKEQLDAWQASDSHALFAKEELARTRQKLLDLEMLRHRSSDSGRHAMDLLAEAGIASNNFQYASLSSQLQNLLSQRSQWINALKLGYSDYQQMLSMLDAKNILYIKLSQDYRDLISRNIIWIPSGESLSLSDVRNAKSGIASLFDARRTAEFGYALQRKWDADRVGGIGILSLVALIMLLRWQAKTWLVDIGGRKRMREATPNARKVAAAVITLLVAFAFPGVLYILARWTGDDVAFESMKLASSGLFAASLVALMIELPRQLLCNYGYLDKYAGVELPRRQRASAYLTLIGMGLVLAAYLITVAEQIDHGMWRDSAARIGLIGSLLLVAWTAHLALRPTGGFLEPLIEKFGGSVIHRLRFVIYLAGIGLPLTLIGLSSLGYGFTVHALMKRAIITWICGVTAATLWPSVKILSSNAWQALTGSTPPRRFDQYGEIKTDATTSVLAEHYLELKHHLAFLCQCALVIGAVICFGQLWIDVFPNVRMGNPVLWTVQESPSQASGDSIVGSLNPQGSFDSVSRLGNTAQQTQVTAFHAALAVVALFVAFQLAKLLPALFDALVLQRVSFDEGMEHFTLVLGRCALFGIGCYVACSLLGIRWHAIQWLAVGLTIGLGFGLQDMVRNLFGGVIVLFEKPARLGDLITVGRVTGRVAAQKFRTTVLSDDEGREVIIPNKNFVNEEVVNWMGAGRLNVIPLEVAVKRDVRSADICRSLQELILEQPEVLLTPAPHATLVCVSKTSQRIEVRAWIESNREPTRYRDSLLKIVLAYLRENDLLASSQPAQPAMRNASSVEDASPYDSLTPRRKF
jgi:potassium-dependent mechanosensitive channel